MNDIEFDDCMEHRCKLSDPCPWCEITRLNTRIEELEVERIELKERIKDLKAEVREWRFATQCGER